MMIRRLILFALLASSAWGQATTPPTVAVTLLFEGPAEQSISGTPQLRIKPHVPFRITNDDGYYWAIPAYWQTIDVTSTTGGQVIALHPNLPGASSYTISPETYYDYEYIDATGSYRGKVQATYGAAVEWGEIHIDDSVDSTSGYLLPTDIIAGSNITVGVEGGSVRVSSTASGGGGGSVSVQDGDVEVVAAASAMDFDGTAFAVTESPSGEANIALNPGTSSSQAAAGNDARFPTAGEKSALAGSSGTPGNSNRYITQEDVATSSTASEIPRADGSGKIANGWLNDLSALLEDGGAWELSLAGLSVAWADITGVPSFLTALTAGAGLVNSGTSTAPIVDVVALAPLLVGTDNVSMLINTASGLCVNTNNELDYDTSRTTLTWPQVSKSGSNLTDLATRNHQDLQTIPGGADGYHLTSAHHTDLTDGGVCTAHTHDFPVDGVELPLVLNGSGNVSLTYEDLFYVNDYGRLGLNTNNVTHNSLAGLDTGDYRHLSAANYTDLTDGGDTALHYNATDRARANHTGTQARSTISDFAHGSTHSDGTDPILVDQGVQIADGRVRAKVGAGLAIGADHAIYADTNGITVSGDATGTTLNVSNTKIQGFSLTYPTSHQAMGDNYVYAWDYATQAFTLEAQAGGGGSFSGDVNSTTNGYLSDSSGILEVRSDGESTNAFTLTNDSSTATLAMYAPDTAGEYFATFKSDGDATGLYFTELTDVTTPGYAALTWEPDGSNAVTLAAYDDADSSNEAILELQAVDLGTSSDDTGIPMMLFRMFENNSTVDAIENADPYKFLNGTTVCLLLDAAGDARSGDFEHAAAATTKIDMAPAQLDLEVSGTEQLTADTTNVTIQTDSVNQDKSIVGRLYSSALGDQAELGVSSTAEASSTMSVSLAANFLRDGRILRFEYSGILDANGTDTVTFRSKLGSTTVATSAAIDPVGTSAVPWTLETTIGVQRSGASGQVAYRQTLQIAGSAVDIVVGTAAVDTTGALTAQISIQESASSASNGVSPLLAEIFADN